MSGKSSSFSAIKLTSLSQVSGLGFERGFCNNALTFETALCLCLLKAERSQDFSLGSSPFTIHPNPVVRKICLRPRATGLMSHTPELRNYPTWSHLTYQHLPQGAKEQLRAGRWQQSLRGSHCSVSQPGCEGGWWRDQPQELNWHLPLLDRELLCQEKALMAQSSRAHLTPSVTSLLIPTTTISSGNTPVPHFHSISPILPMYPATLAPALGGNLLF